MRVTAGPVFGAVAGGYTVLIGELVRRSRLNWVQAAVAGIEAAGARAGRCATTSAATGPPKR